MARIDYIGKAEYCYANSAAMLLAASDRTIPPATIEVCCGIGLSAFVEPENNWLFFSPFVVAPDAGLTRAFDLLGFDIDHQSLTPKAAIDNLPALLARGPVLIGPVDMGHLSYNPRRSTGADHFIVIYGQDDNDFLLHDPYGYPNVRLSADKLLAAWKAETIDYKQADCQYWQSPRAVKSLTSNQLADRVWQFFREIYKQIELKRATDKMAIGAEAIRQTATALADGILASSAVDFLTGFSLPLAAKRANDYATFLARTQPDFARLKFDLADQFGNAQSDLTADETAAAVADLRRIADLETRVAGLLQ